MTDTHVGHGDDGLGLDYCLECRIAEAARATVDEEARDA